MIQWISVKDKLPEIGKMCVVKIFCSTEPRISVLQNAQVKAADGKRSVYLHWSGQGTLTVTHWIELPGFPEDEEWASKWYETEPTILA